MSWRRPTTRTVCWLNGNGWPGKSTTHWRKDSSASSPCRRPGRRDWPSCRQTRACPPRSGPEPNWPGSRQSKRWPGRIWPRPEPWWRHSHQWTWTAWLCRKPFSSWPTGSPNGPEPQSSWRFRGLPKRAQEVVLLRAVQEALTNVRRHAGAAAVHIRLVYENARATVEIIDDGVGFSPTQGAGFGLPGMRDRVHAAGGLVAVDSELGRGTRVVVQVPAAAHAAPAEADVPPAAAQETTAERGNR
ncbi:MAG: hypothetical protein CSB46_00130 [Micrococcales bacterium]|nr:MAG: hypothetical protein CSB46_00130 [Micrococcales bacterium]